MSFFFIKKMSQNLWATIMPFGPVTLIFYWPKKKNQASLWLSLISGTESVCNIRKLIDCYWMPR